MEVSEDSVWNLNTEEGNVTVTFQFDLLVTVTATAISGDFLMLLFGSRGWNKYNDNSIIQEI